MIAPQEELLKQSIVQFKKAHTGGITAPQNLEASINQAKGTGQPLADQIRGPMEQAFGTDFSQVRIHTNLQSDQLNRSLQARAFTTGQNLFFRQGEYNPGSSRGRELLAHELTHVVQQRQRHDMSNVQTNELIETELGIDLEFNLQLILGAKPELGSANITEEQRLMSRAW
ncbi:MAG: DUF4157 domain-containing protein [Prochloraceae cyanobacterium]|nr:DUF4157 domain-containing protein [Prochloraceae cyanobacterium]